MGRAGVLLGRSGAAGADRWARREGLAAGVRRLFPEPPVGQPPGRVGLTAKRGHRRSRGPGAAYPGAARRVRRPRGPAATALGRLSSEPDDGRVLAGAPEPAARPAALPAAR